MQPAAVEPSRVAADRSQRSTRTAKLREQIVQEIITAQLPPGARLDEQELAKRFGVSRTPVREALRELAATGLVVIRPHRGATVAGITSERLSELFEALVEVESLCARLAALKMTREERLRLSAIHEEAREIVVTDPDAFFDLNERFHAAIYRGARNSLFDDVARNVHTRMWAIFKVQLRVTPRAPQSFAEHEKIVQAIVRGDAEGSDLAMRAHVLASRVDLERHAASLIAESSGQPATAVQADSRRQRMSSHPRS
jgi:DNA-binding GntR family transcriptional regulator